MTDDLNSNINPDQNWTSKSIKLLPEQQFLFKELNEKPQETEITERVFYNDGFLKLYQPIPAIDNYVYLIQKGEIQATITFQLNQENRVQRITALKSAMTIAMLLDSADYLPYKQKMIEILDIPKFTYEIKQKVQKEIQEKERLRQKIKKVTTNREDKKTLLILAYLKMAKNYEEDGRNLEALSAFNKVIGFDPDNKEALDGVYRIQSKIAENMRKIFHL